MNKRRIRILLLIVAALSLLPAYLHAYKITGASEVPTVLVGDTILVNSAAWRLKLPYTNVTLLRTGTPRRGDFVRLRTKYGFKRILGLPGETIELRENRVIVNGSPLPLSPLHHLGTNIENEDGHWIMFTPGKDEHRNHPPTHLSPHEYFLLGDNRDDSIDSREFGPVSDDVFEGKVIAVFHAAR